MTLQAGRRCKKFENKSRTPPGIFLRRIFQVRSVIPPHGRPPCPRGHFPPFFSRPRRARLMHPPRLCAVSQVTSSRSASPSGSVINEFGMRDAASGTHSPRRPSSPPSQAPSGHPARCFLASLATPKQRPARLTAPARPIFRRAACSRSALLRALRGPIIHILLPSRAPLLPTYSRSAAAPQARRDGRLST